MNDTILDEEAVKLLVAVVVSPRLDVAFSGSGSPLLEHAEHLIAKLKEIPRIEAKLKCMEIKLTFGRKLKKLGENLEVVRSAIKELRNSQRLRALLELILAIGNFINSKHAVGFRVGDLLKLESLPCNDTFVVSMLHYVSDLLEKIPGTIGCLCAELTHVPRASRVDLKLVSSRLSTLGKQLDDVSCTVQPNDFHMHANVQIILDTHKNELAEVKNLCVIVHKEYLELVCYFEEDPGTPPEIFTIITKFLDSLERAKEENQHQKNKKAIKPKTPVESAINNVNSEKLFNKTLLLLKNGSIFRR